VSENSKATRARANIMQGSARMVADVKRMTNTAEASRCRGAPKSTSGVKIEFVQETSNRAKETAKM